MARKLQFTLTGYPQHIIQRGNNRSVLLGDDADRLFYLDKRKAACERFECRIHANILMTNHVHLLMPPETVTGICKTMQSLGRRYVQYFNWRYQRIGTLWEGRYKASVLDTERYLQTCYRYIEMNAVRAGMVDHPQDHRWSSHASNATGHTDPLVIPHKLYLQLGQDEARRRTAYRTLFENGIGTENLITIREATNGDWAIGNERFRNEIEALLQRRVGPGSRGSARKSAVFRDTNKINRV